MSDQTCLKTGARRTINIGHFSSTCLASGFVEPSFHHGWRLGAAPETEPRATARSGSPCRAPSTTPSTSSTQHFTPQSIPHQWGWCPPVLGLVAPVCPLLGLSRVLRDMTGALHRSDCGCRWFTPWPEEVVHCVHCRKRCEEARRASAPRAPRWVGRPPPVGEPQKDGEQPVEQRCTT